MDYNISGSDQLRGRIVSNRITAIDNTPNLPQFFSLSPTHQYLFTLAEYHTFRRLSRTSSGSATTGTTIEFLLPPLRIRDWIHFPTSPSTTISAFRSGPTPMALNPRFSTPTRLVNNVSWVRGSHNFKFGFDGRDLIAPQQFTQRVRGDYDYSTLNQYLNDFSPDDLSERSISD